jgi:hypothetical protein
VRTRLAIALLLLAGCSDEPEEVSFKGHLITIPAGWETARDGYGPHQTLALVPPESPMACRLVVVRDSRRFGDTDARAFLATGRDRYGGVDEAPREISTADGVLEGYVRTGVEIPDAWGVRVAPGQTHLEIYAAGRGTELVGMMIGWYESEARYVDRCRSALSSLSR